MLNVDIAKLEKANQDLCALLKDGMTACSIWDRSTGLTLTAYNSYPAADALFTQVTTELSETLANSGFPKLNRYYLLDVEGGNIIVVILHGEDLLQGMLLTSKVNLGVLLGIAIPKMLDSVAKARN